MGECGSAKGWEPSKFSGVFRRFWVVVKWRVQTRQRRIHLALKNSKIVSYVLRIRLCLKKSAPLERQEGVRGAQIHLLPPGEALFSPTAFENQPTYDSPLELTHSPQKSQKWLINQENITGLPRETEQRARTSEKSRDWYFDNDGSLIYQPQVFAPSQQKLFCTIAIF